MRAAINNTNQKRLNKNSVLVFFVIAQAISLSNLETGTGILPETGTVSVQRFINLQTCKLIII